MDIALPYNWSPRNYQLPAWRHFQDTPRARGVLLWHRRCGKDLFSLNLCGVKAHERIGTYWHVFPTYRQGKEIIWNGATKDSRKFLDYFPPDLIDHKHETDLRITFRNGSNYRIVGSDNFDSLVGTNPIGVIMSEYSLQDPAAWNYIRPILAENDGWALFNYTARGRNHGFDLYEMARNNPRWFCEKLVAGSGPECTKKDDGTPVISDEAIEEERQAGMSEEMIQQEFKNSFDAPMSGAYYSQQMDALERRGQITKVPHDPNLQVDTYWDIGMRDSTTIWFIQQHRDTFRVIDYYEMSGEPLAHYVKIIRGQREGHEHRQDYTYRYHFGPHDIQVTEFTTGITRIEAARKLGLKFRVVPMHEVLDGIEATRSVLSACWFDHQRTDKGLKALRSYHKKWNEKQRIFQDNPEHDWSSHAADSFRMFAMSIKVLQRSLDSRPKQSTALDDYDYLNGRNKPTSDSRYSVA